jgi:hypothetical protein
MAADRSLELGRGADLNLAPFRRRIRLLRAWRCAAIGGCAGAVAAAVMAAVDYFNIRYFEPWMLAIPVGAGVAAGIVKAVFERLPGEVVARSVDRRGRLNDRLTSAVEIPAVTGSLSAALHEDAASKVGPLRPSALYPIRPGRWHGAFVCLAILAVLVFLLGNAPFLKSAQARHDASELKKAAVEVERVVKPVLDDAKRPDAEEPEKALAHKLDRFGSELKKGRMSKQEALLKANQLAEEARKLETRRSQTLASSVMGAQTAAAQLGKMSDKAGLEKSDALKLAEEASSAEREVADLEKQLAAQKAGKSNLTAKERAALEKKLAAARKNLEAIKLSQRAEEMLRKLQATPEFKEAQEILSKLAAGAAAQQAGGDPQELSREQLEAAAKRLEELAKQLNSDEKLREYARQLLEAARNARLCKNGKCAGGLLGAFGLGAGLSAGGLSLGGSRGAGSPSLDRWAGAHGQVYRSDKSSLLNVKFGDRIITSQQGKSGPETYVDVIGPSSPTNKSSVPYQAVLPKYTKSAESALNKSDIPPGLRGKVRDYFDSLRK